MGYHPLGHKRVRHDLTTKHHKFLFYFRNSVQFLSHFWLFTTPWTAACQASLSISNSLSLLKLMSVKCHPTISSSVIRFSSCLQSFSASGPFLKSQFFVSGGESIGASASASVLPVNIQDWFTLDFRLVWFPCSPRESQESSPQFKSIIFSVLGFPYGPTLTSIHDHWKYHSID